MNKCLVKRVNKQNLMAPNNITFPIIPRRTLLKRIAELAECEGVEVYPVGGFVRDWLLHRPVTEIDFVVTGDGPAFAKKVADMLGIHPTKHTPKWPVVFEQFGTAMLSYRGTRLEFVGARKEAYRTSSRKPVVTPGTLEDDLKRRDFTINALAMSIHRTSFGQIIDRFQGLDDLKQKVLRTPAAPEIAFSEDPLRILRAIRFATQLNFGISRPTLEAMSGMTNRLSIVSQERITEELRKILNAPKPSVGFKLMYVTGVMEVVLPELASCHGVETRGEYGHKDVLEHTLRVLDRVAELTDITAPAEPGIKQLDGTLQLQPVTKKREAILWAALFHDIAKPRTKRFQPDTGYTFYGHEDVGARMMGGIGRTLRLPQDVIQPAQTIISLHMRPIHLAEDGVTDSAIRRLIVDAGDDLNALLTLCRADITSGNPKKIKRYVTAFNQLVERLLLVLEKDKLRAFQSPVRGEEIMEITGLTPSPMVGRLKKMIEEAILDGQIPNEHDAAREYLISIKDQILASKNNQKISGEHT
jgi:poly(A) polymerase